MGCGWSLPSRSREAKSTTSPSTEGLLSTSLSVQLYKAKVKSHIDPRGFVPLDALDKLLTEEAIKSELIRAGVANITPHLLRYVLEHAKKIFAILVMTGNVELIERVLLDGLEDVHLPIEIDRGIARPYDHDSDNLSTNKRWTIFQDQTLESMVFCEYQWRFLAPVFTEHGYKYFLHMECPLPFVDGKRMMGGERFSHHSRVYKACIHEAHRQWGNSEGPYVAIKELPLGNSSEYNAEARTLKKLSKLAHPHLIKCLATYQRGHNYCFIFHWAEGGNLRQFWAQQDRVSRDMELIQWALLQMKGLADGLKVLHNFSLQENCRHGDLKPENILRFLKADSSGLGRLVLSDLGSATFHEERTQSRTRGTGVGYGTLRYEPPEARKERNRPRSRRYDVWSTGCIFLEFTIWLLYGWDDLEWFNQELDRYWLDEGDSVRVHPNVLGYIEGMKNDPRCPRGSALGDLLQAIQGRLLVPEHGNEFENEDISTWTTDSNRSVPEIESDVGVNTIRADSKELDMILGGIIHRLNGDPGYAFKEEGWVEAKGRRLDRILKQRQRSMISLPISHWQDNQAAEQGEPQL
ncbi:hypothetical protein CEP54_012923 [Fusarium duplospermum]|uniref:Protein kinase domain-containing protein n=1 Tax=Fusarium duplospermum TaxID=1325734 RepID=A0A428P648_9HYPO|nr:hypothetical protein CEP54_012923 [Fusarium duplospermum]